MKVEDRHIEAALRLGCHKSPLKADAAIEQIKRDPDYYVHRYILSHALTLAKLECAVEALEAIQGEALREGSLDHHLRRCAAVQSKQALTQIRSESHE